MSPYLTSKQVAELTGYSQRHLVHLTRRGEIKPVFIKRGRLEHGRHLLFKDSVDFRHFLETITKRQRSASRKKVGTMRVKQREWPPYLEALGRLAKLRNYVVKHPFSDWPREGREKFQTDLKLLGDLLRPITPA